MKFEWDERKNQANMAKHGIDFRAASAVFDGPYYIDGSKNAGTDTERKIVVGLIKGRVSTVIFTLRNDKIRIISARRARDGEEEKYRKLYS